MLRTFLLLAALTALFMTAGYLLGGEDGMIMAFMMALVMNFITYWFSDSIVLKMYRAVPISPAENPELYRTIEDLAQRASIPTPKAYIIENPQPNAFATGRNPQHGALALTTGLLNTLDERELAGVIAHEISHIKNRDTLTMTITATLAGAIGMLANFAFLFGGRSNNGRSNPIAALLVMILAPIMATLVQLAVSRTREYAADRTGADISGEPLALASALAKISNVARRVINPHAEANPGTAHLFIVNPLHGRSIDNLFATHPNTENRIRALQEYATEMRGQVPSAPLSRKAFGPWG